MIVVTDPDEDGKALVVNITTECGDCTTVYDRRDHKPLSHSSEVNYAGAMFANVLDLEDALDGKVRCGELTMERSIPCSADFLKRIRAGFLKSCQTHSTFKTFCEKLWDKNGDQVR